MTHFLGLITTIKAKTIWMRRVTEAPINRCASRHSMTSPWPTTGTVLSMQQESLIKVRRCRAIGVVRTFGRALPRGSQRLREVKCDLPAGERQHLQPCGSTAVPPLDAPKQHGCKRAPSDLPSRSIYELLLIFPLGAVLFVYRDEHSYRTRTKTTRRISLPLEKCWACKQLNK